MPSVVSLGELLIDFASISTSENGYPVLASNPGGAVANYLAVLSKYGMDTALISKVGNDMFGNLLVQTIEGLGINASNIIIDNDSFTTLAFVTFDEHGERTFAFARKPGADTRLAAEEIDRSLIDSCSIFHFGTLSMTDEPARTATIETVLYAKKQGKLISLDPNLRLPLWNDTGKAREAMLWGFEHADIVKISDEESEWLWGCTGEDAADILLEQYGVSLALITLGSKGCFLKNKNAGVGCACPPVTPVDTTGCGDIFGGSAAYCILKTGKHPADLTGSELESIARFSVTAASLASEKHGGIPSIPELQRVKGRIS